MMMITASDYSLSVLGSALETVVSMICELSNCSDPFVMIACSAATQTRIRSFVSLTPPPFSKPLEITRVYESLRSHDSRLMLKNMVWAVMVKLLSIYL
jgi:hypothetical protein